MWQFWQTVPNLELKERCGAGYCDEWHELQLMAVLVEWTNDHVGYLWHSSQVVGYFVGFDTWLAGLFARWHDWQLAVEAVCVYEVAVQVGYLWHSSQVVGYADGFEVCVTGLAERWHTEQFAAIEA